jgi:DNA-binding transcriptional regulator YhcF (GntR family)
LIFVLFVLYTVIQSIQIILHPAKYERPGMLTDSIWNPHRRPAAMQERRRDMIIRIDELSDVPIYLQIRNQIVMGISDGKLMAGEQLPTVRSLALEMGINTMTVSKAYQLLKTEGFILTDRKNGARVRSEIEQKGSISDSNKKELKRIISESRLSGVPRQELHNLVDEFYGRKK